MKLKIISCNVFKAELEAVMPGSPHHIDIEFIEIGEHARPNSLRLNLQQKIDAAIHFDAVLLCYGLCGTATAGLTARTVPLVMPRSHDCCGILLGSRKRFEEIFRPMPSTPFASIGFAASGDYYFSDGELTHGDAYAKLVEQYGEDNARYVWETMHPKLDGRLQPIYFIHTVPAPETVAECRVRAETENREFRELDGNLRLLRMLVSGDWPDDEFLTIAPGETVRQAGDWNEIVRAERTH